MTVSKVKRTVGTLLAAVLSAMTVLPWSVGAQPLSWPAERVWSVSLNNRQVVWGPSWGEDGSIYVLYSADNALREIRDGSINVRGETIADNVDAIERGDVDGDGNLEVLVSVSNDTGSYLTIRNENDFREISRITLGLNWSRYDDEDTTFGPDFGNETAKSLKWLGGDQGLVLIGKTFEVFDQTGSASGHAITGGIYLYSMVAEAFIDSIACGGKQHWAEAGEDLLVGSSFSDGWFCGMYFGSSSTYAELYNPMLGGLGKRRLAELEGGSGNWPFEQVYCEAMGYFERSPDEAYSVSSVVHGQEGTGTSLFCLNRLPQLDSVLVIELGSRPLVSFAYFENDAGDGARPYLACFEDQGLVRLFDIQDLRFNEQTYTSPVGGINVHYSDYDGDDRKELIGWNGSLVSCVRPNMLGVSNLEEPNLPAEIQLTVFPNPFNSSTTFSYTLPSPGRYVLTVTDIAGREVARLSEGWKEARSYREVWEGQGVGSGNYLLRIESGGQSRSVSLSLIK